MQASSELRDIITGWFKAVETGDITWCDRHVSGHPDLRVAGTDPVEWLKGAAAEAFMRREAVHVVGKLKANARDVEAYTEGNVGWGIARPEITLMDGSKVSPRWSAVFVNDGSNWRMVQLHASIAIGNEAAFGDTFE